MPDAPPRVHPLLLSACAHPREWDRLLVLADAVDEAGDAVEALGWRLLAGERKWPHEANMELRLWWWSAWGVSWSLYSDEALPTEVFSALTAGVEADGMYRDYRDRRNGRACTALSAALADAARAYGRAWLAGWRPGEGVR